MDKRGSAPREYLSRVQWYVVGGLVALLLLVGLPLVLNWKSLLVAWHRSGMETINDRKALGPVERPFHARYNWHRDELVSLGALTRREFSFAHFKALKDNPAVIAAIQKQQRLGLNGSWSSLAIRVLRGERLPRRCATITKDKAAAWLRAVSGQDFGTDADAWRAWLKENRWAYYRFPPATG